MSVGLHTEPIYGISLFSGVDGLGRGVALALPGLRTVCYVEREAYPIEVLAQEMEAGTLDPGVVWSDVTTFRAVDFAERVLRATGRRVEVVYGGFPCFTAGTLVLAERGYVPIESLSVGDRVLTHRGRWRRVTSVMFRQAESTRIVSGQGFPDICTTDEHPFYTRRQGRRWNNARRAYDRTFEAADWIESEQLAQGDYVGQVLPVEPVAVPDEPDHDGSSVDFWWIVGRYLADGWRTRSNNKGRVVICANPQECEEVEGRIRRVIHCSTSRERTVVKFHITRQWLYDWLLQFGTGAAGKLIPGWVLSLDKVRAAALLDGYIGGDGSHYRNCSGDRGGVKVTTVSRALALGIALLAQRAYGIVASIHESNIVDQTTIEGRVVRQRRQYQVVIPERNRVAFVEGDYGWKMVHRTEPSGSNLVWNISVKDDESYVADGVIVHNCQDISTAGKGAGIEGERSGLWREFARVVREVGPRYVFVENVAALVGRGLAVVLQALAECGYRYAWGTLEAADVGATHHRKRLFLVAVADSECVDSPGWGGSGHLEGATRTSESDGKQWERGGSSTDRPVSGSGEGALVDSHLSGLEVGGGERRHHGPQCSTAERASGPLSNGPLALADGGHDQPQEQEGTDGLDQQRQTVGGWQFQPAGPGADGRDLGGDHTQRDDGHPVAAEDRGDPATDMEDAARGGERGPLGEVGLGWGVRQAGESLDGSLPTYPPGPDELDDWDAALADHPWLAPAIVGAAPAQSDLRRVADGTATWDDVHLCTCPRAERLKALGNGVVPMQAAWSYLQLLDRLGAI